MRLLVTGSAGFIGFHVAKRLLDDGHDVVGVDNFSDYYDPSLKEARNSILCAYPRFRLHRIDICDSGALMSAWGDARPKVVIHLAAQAGVRHSIYNPRAYVDSNVIGSLNVLEAARAWPPCHLMIAGTSSAYGSGSGKPSREGDTTAHPLSLYAATKGAAELMAHSYSHLFGIPVTVMRFFTVYGPWGRPDMAPMRFAKAMLSGQAIDVYGNGHMTRDFTFIDDVSESVVRLMDAPAPYRTVNVGGGQPVDLMTFIGELECSLGVKSAKRFLPMQPGDVRATAASPDVLFSLTGYSPSTALRNGVRRFAEWYRWWALTRPE